jgi:hypothetical protein
MEVTGKLNDDQTKEVGSGGFKKRDVVVTTDEHIHNIFRFNLFKINVI